MKIEDLVLSIEQMNHLKELGLKVNDTALCWVEQIYDRCGHLLPKNTFKLEYDKFEISIMNRLSSVIPTLTLQEILELLPSEIEFNTLYGGKECATLNINWDNIKPCIWYEANEVNLSLYVNDSLLEASYEMLCWLLENGYLKE